MKKITKFMSSLALIGSALSMAGCAKTIEAVAYGVDKVASNYGIMIYKADVTVNNGKITGASLEETYSPNVWARITAEQAETIDSVSTKDFNGDQIYFAKYIYVNGMNWKADVDSETYKYLNEYVVYSAIGASSEDAASDLIRYLSVSDSGQYKLGTFANTYFDDVMNDRIKILKNTSKDKENKENKENLVLTDSGIAPSFPDGKKKKTENTACASWTSSANALCTYLTGKALNYKDRVAESNFDNHSTIKVNDDGVWQYNPTLANTAAEDDAAIAAAEANSWETITGCNAVDIKQMSLESYLYGFNQAFASVEYQSIA